jgi:hypothetical protein
MEKPPAVVEERGKAFPCAGSLGKRPIPLPFQPSSSRRTPRGREEISAARATFG